MSSCRWATADQRMRNPRFALSTRVPYVESMTKEQKLTLSEVIWIDPERMSGTPCFQGTRVPVQHLLDYIEGASTIEEFLVDYPSVTREQVIQFLELGKDQLIECAS